MKRHFSDSEPEMCDLPDDYDECSRYARKGRKMWDSGGVGASGSDGGGSGGSDGGGKGGRVPINEICIVFFGRMPAVFCVAYDTCSGVLH